MNYRLAITKDRDVEKIRQVGLFNPAKQKRLDKISASLSRFHREKADLKEQLLNTSKSRTLNELSDVLNLAPFVVRRLLRSLPFRKVGVKQVGSRNQIVYACDFTQ